MDIILRIKRLFFSVNEAEATFARRNFYRGEGNLITWLEKVGKQFLKGYHLALEFPPGKPLTDQLDQDDKAFTGFRYEGAAMAFTLLDFLHPFSKHAFQDFIDEPAAEKHTYMLHVGIGWGLARLPVNIEKRILQYDPLLRWLIIDGYGFHQAYFKTTKYVVQQRLPKNLRGEYARQVFHQGMGRCLWFIECANTERIAKRIEEFPLHYQPHLWAGVGLACTYAGGATEAEIRRLRQLADPFVLHLAQGAVFAAKARHRAGLVTEPNELACRLICGLPVATAARLADTALQEVPATLPSAQQYEHWRKNIRQHFTKTGKYEVSHEKVDS